MNTASELEDGARHKNQVGSRAPACEVMINGAVYLAQRGSLERPGKVSNIPSACLMFNHTFKSHSSEPQTPEGGWLYEKKYILVDLCLSRSCIGIQFLVIRSSFPAGWNQSEMDARYDLTSSLWGLVKVLSQGQQRGGGVGLAAGERRRLLLERETQISWCLWKTVIFLIPSDYL